MDELDSDKMNHDDNQKYFKMNGTGIEMNVNKHKSASRKLSTCWRPVLYRMECWHGVKYWSTFLEWHY